MLSKGYSTILFLLVALVAAYAVSCTGDLNTSPIDERVTTSADVYDTPEDFRQVLAKLYAGYATTGQQGPAGNADIQGIDEGFSQYIRQYWVHQTLPTDEAVVGWNDPGLPDFNFQSWTASNDFVMGMYSRIFYQVTLTNEFIRQAQPRTEAEIQGFKAEARFLRAMTYWHALDFYGGNVPFVTENDPIGAFLPQQTNAQDLFTYIETELLAILDNLPAPQQNEYGRADRAAAWMVLAKLYLNAEVYIGQDRYSDALEYAERIIDQGGYVLADNYEHLFMADNDRPAMQQSIIFPIRFDGDNIRTFGGTTFIIHAGVGGDMSAEDFGIGGGWAGHRVTPQLVEKFDVDVDGNSDDGRALFFTDGQELEIESLSNFTHGYASSKWKNVTSTGEPGSNSSYVDTDFPMFRLADAHLIYAEAHLRGGGGSLTRAVELVNDLRERAYGDQSGNITGAQLDLDFILDERARELYWEGHRRTDLIRYGLFTSADYVWAWKGNEQNGTSTHPRNVIFPLPSSDVNANPNLDQNDDY